MNQTAASSAYILSFLADRGSVAYFLMALFWYGIYFIQIARLCTGDEVKWRREERFDKVRWQKKTQERKQARCTAHSNLRWKKNSEAMSSEREREGERERTQAVESIIYGFLQGLVSYVQISYSKLIKLRLCSLPATKKRWKMGIKKMLQFFFFLFD